MVSKNAKTIRKLISVGIVLVMAIVFSVTSDAFLNYRNIMNLFQVSAYLGLIALGMTFVMIGGGIDLSAGGIVCIAGVLSVRFSMTGLPGFIIVLGGVVIGALCGGVNAFFITKIRLTEFVTTLATGFVFTGLTLVFAYRRDGLITSARIINRSYLAFSGDIGGLHYFSIMWIALTVITYFILTRTKFGLHTYAIGSNKKSAQMSSVNVDRIKTLGYVICGGFAGLASVMQASAMGAAPTGIGTGYEFRAIAACVVGGVVLGGGKGDTVGAFIGSLFLVMLLNGLFKFGIATSWEYFLQGLIILVATAFDAIFNSISNKRLMARSR